MMEPPSDESQGSTRKRRSCELKSKTERSTADENEETPKKRSVQFNKSPLLPCTCNIPFSDAEPAEQTSRRVLLRYLNSGCSRQSIFITHIPLFW
jgi:hypothetical protein